MRNTYTLNLTAGELLLIAGALEEYKLYIQDCINDKKDEIVSIDIITKKIITNLT